MHFGRQARIDQAYKNLELYDRRYAEAQSDGALQLDPDLLLPIDQLKEEFGTEKSIQVLPAATYLKYGIDNLRYWANMVGVFSIPTLELAQWLDECYDLSKIHEVGCGNGALAKFLKIKCSDGRLNANAHKKSMAIAGIPHAYIPPNIATRTANQVAEHFKPPIMLAQWVTPGNGTYDVVTGRNEYGPDYKKVLEHVDRLVFIGNQHTHGQALSIELPPPDETYKFDWLLSRAKFPDQNFIKLATSPRNQ
jgi:hypothetical protein